MSFDDNKALDEASAQIVDSILSEDAQKDDEIVDEFVKTLINTEQRQKTPPPQSKDASEKEEIVAIIETDPILEPAQEVPEPAHESEKIEDLTADVSHIQLDSIPKQVEEIAEQIKEKSEDFVEDVVERIEEILPREPSPELVKEPSPELVKEPSPELVKEPFPEPVKEPSPEPVKEPSPVQQTQDWAADVSHIQFDSIPKQVEEIAHNIKEKSEDFVEDVVERVEKILPKEPSHESEKFEPEETPASLRVETEQISQTRHVVVEDTKASESPKPQPATITPTNEDGTSSSSQKKDGLLKRVRKNYCSII